MDQFDILFIGSGISCMLSLLEMLSSLNTAPLSTPLKIAVVEKQKKIWSGIPFGYKSSVNSLIINSVKEFLIDDTQRLNFIDWLKTNEDKCLTSFIINGGSTAKTWLQHNQQLIQAGKWDSLYIPRYWYGEYIIEKLNAAIATAATLNLAVVTPINAEVIQIKRNRGQMYLLTTALNKSYQLIITNKLVLTVGSPPVKSLAWAAANPAFNYIKNVYSRSMDATLKSIQKSLMQTAEPDKRNILILGSNASCIELLYLLCHEQSYCEMINQITVLSPRGKLPVQVNNDNEWNATFTNLNYLTQCKSNYTSGALIEAAVADLQLINQNGVAMPVVQQLIDYVTLLKKNLLPDEDRLFHKNFGPAVSRNIRRTGDDYRGAATRLQSIGKLKLIKGNFINLKTAEHSVHLTHLNYLDEHKKLVTCPQPFCVAVNCTGFENLTNTSSKLLNNLVEEKLCTINSSRRGIEVNEALEASKDVYVMGPLLAGNNNKTVHFWHVENVSRIIQLAPLLANEVLAGFKNIYAAEAADIKQ